MVCRMSAKIQSEKRNETNLLKWLNNGNISSTYPFICRTFAAAVSLSTTEKDKMRNYVMFNLQNNGDRCKRTAE